MPSAVAAIRHPPTDGDHALRMRPPDLPAPRSEGPVPNADDRRAELRTVMERERARLVEAAPGSPEWDAARAALDDLEWELTSLEGPAPEDESI